MLDWEKAIQHLQTYKVLYAGIGPAGMFGILIMTELEQRYDDGERTQELYDEMMGIE